MSDCEICGGRHFDYLGRPCRVCTPTEPTIVVHTPGEAPDAFGSYLSPEGVLVIGPDISSVALGQPEAAPDGSEAAPE